MTDQAFSQEFYELMKEFELKEGEEPKFSEYFLSFAVNED